MSYLSLARKYRPRNFDEIVGQEHVTTTLKNAIAMDRAAHAYLFAGPRGVGKTSTARILAKSLNCEKAPTPTPCEECTSCREIVRAISMDVIEIDGASNRGIDEIRNLKENIKFASLHGKFRIYIIDEVHMLTQEAFNALLKTLEEPPPHVKFIFATTKPYKVLPTIISRCQRFDFRRIHTRDIVKKLEGIRETEKLDLTDEAIFMITKASDGSMRDAEVILDQLLSFAKGKVGPNEVAQMLGLLEQEVLFGIADCVLNGDKEEIMSFVNNLIESGKDPAFIASSIIEHFRNLMVVKAAKESSKTYMTASDEDYYKLQEQSRKFSLEEILYVTYTLSAAIDMIRKTSLRRIPLEISLIKLTERKRLSSIKEVLEKLNAVEEKLKERSFTVPDDAIAESAAPPPVAAQKMRKEPVGEKPETGFARSEIAAEKDILLLQSVKSAWLKILGFIKGKKMSVAMYLAEGELVRIKGDVLTIGFEKNNTLHKEALESNVNKKFIEGAIKNIVGEDVFLNFETLEGRLERETETNEPAKIEEPPEATKRIDPIVESALDIFDGKIINVREKDPGRRQ